MPGFLFRDPQLGVITRKRASTRKWTLVTRKRSTGAYDPQTSVHPQPGTLHPQTSAIHPQTSHPQTSTTYPQTTHPQTGDRSFIRKPANTTPALGRSHQPATGVPLRVTSRPRSELDPSTFTLIPARLERTSSPYTLHQGRREQTETHMINIF